MNIFLADHDVGVAGRGEVTGDGSLMLNKPKPKAGDEEAGNVLMEHESLASPCRLVSVTEGSLTCVIECF